MSPVEIYEVSKQKIKEKKIWICHSIILGGFVALPILLVLAIALNWNVDSFLIGFGVFGLAITFLYLAAHGIQWFIEAFLKQENIVKKETSIEIEKLVEANAKLSKENEELKQIKEKFQQILYPSEK